MNPNPITFIFLFQITVDSTPPVAGVVQDGPGDTDIDYQQSLTLHANWHNFFDRESTISFYQYAFAEECLGADYFYLPTDGQVSGEKVTGHLNSCRKLQKQFVQCQHSWILFVVIQILVTTDTFASTTVAEPGSYHATVVAYNAAMEPSKPVCSDGVTVDTTNPMVSGIIMYRYQRLIYSFCCFTNKWWRNPVSQIRNILS